MVCVLSEQFCKFAGGMTGKFFFVFARRPITPLRFANSVRPFPGGSNGAQFRSTVLRVFSNWESLSVYAK